MAQSLCDGEQIFTDIHNQGIFGLFNRNQTKQIKRIIGGGYTKKARLLKQPGFENRRRPTFPPNGS
ncbi:MAG: hypothetical protein ACEPOW_09760, partial [Bacteroidales bacterium]